MKKLIATLVVLWGGGALAYWYFHDAQNHVVSYRTVEVSRGDLKATINATGTLEPDDVVDVGAQIAGEIQSFGPDPRDASRPISYGSPVEQGTVLARLDDALYRSRVDQAQATVDKARADVEQAEAKSRQTERELERLRRLQNRGNGMVSAQEYDTALAADESAQAGLAVARSAVKVAQANLEEARINLGYTTIRSPVKGVILDRRVNIGQTVVASLNAPSLFLIAKDLGHMEIWASVNETDIGSIHEGQPVTFTVASFPHEHFPGKVAQIRLNASMTQSVVTYTVVVNVDNTDRKLLPYLTARLQFEVEERKNVLLVPNPALRWQPRSQHVVPEAREAYAQALRKRATGAGAGTRTAASGTKQGAPGTLWATEGEFVRPIEVRVGMTDGVLTEIVSGPLKQGAHVVTGLARQSDEDETNSPFLPQIKNDKAKH